MYGIALEIPDCAVNKRFLDSPFCRVRLPNNDLAAKIAKRCLTVACVSTLDAYGTSVDEMFKGLEMIVAEKADFYSSHMSEPFKYEFETFQAASSGSKAEIMHRLGKLGFVGVVDMKQTSSVWRMSFDFAGKPKQLQFVYFGKFIANGGRDIPHKYSLKTRHFIGITSMDPLLSLLMANMAQIQPGHLVFDPFVGTGSMVIAAAHFGGFAMGSDIDGRQFRGISNPSRAKHQWKEDEAGQSLHSNLVQYGLTGRMVDVWTSDLTAHSLRYTKDGWMDSIITDPPYGIRASARKTKAIAELPFVPINPNRYPETEIYANDQVLCDLLDFAAQFLRVGGRLVYWLPTLPDVFSTNDIPHHPSLKIQHYSAQKLCGWDRVLITMQKCGPYDLPGFETAWNHGSKRPQDVPHAAFREWYFSEKNRSAE